MPTFTNKEKMPVENSQLFNMSGLLYSQGGAT